MKNTCSFSSSSSSTSHKIVKEAIHSIDDNYNDDVIILRPFDLSDAKHFMEWATADSALSIITSEEKAFNFINKFASSHPYFRAICRKSNNVAIGSVSVTPPKEENAQCRAFLGYAVAPKYRGKGIATKAVTMVVDVLFNEWPHLERIEAIVEVENKASQRVLEKVGFKREGVLRKYVVLRMEPTDVIMYSLLSTEIQSLTSSQ